MPASRTPSIMRVVPNRTSNALSTIIQNINPSIKPRHHPPSTPPINTVLVSLLRKPQAPRLSRRLWRRRLAPAPNLRTTLKHPPLSEDVFLMVVTYVRVIVLGLALEQVEDVLHAELADGLATFDGCLGKFALGFLQFEDPLLDAVVD